VGLVFSEYFGVVAQFEGICLYKEIHSRNVKRMTYEKYRAFKL
jgi:hypothetical protein